MKMEARRAHFEPAADGRGAPRRKLRFGVQGANTTAGPAEVVIHDISETGFLIETVSQLTPGETIELELPHAGSRCAEVVWISGDFYGCRFERAISKAAVSATLLRAPAGSLPSISVAEPVSAASAEETPPQTTHGSRDGQLSPRAKAWTILGLAVLSWCIVGVVVAGLVA
jgi:hypothetical protein